MSQPGEDDATPFTRGVAVGILVVLAILALLVVGFLLGMAFG